MEIKKYLSVRPITRRADGTWENRMAEDGQDPEEPQNRARKIGKGGPGGPSPLPPRMRMTRGAMSWVGFVLIALMIALVVSQGYTPPQTLTIDQFWKLARTGKFSEITIGDDYIAAE